jgi:chromosome segregation protein
MNYYVVDNEAHAYQAVNLLSDASKGKANFFVLSTFENFVPSVKQSFDKCIAAIDIAEFDPKYKQLVTYILNDVYIVLEDQNEIPHNSNAVFITQNGKITKRKFSISGGSVGLFEGKRIGRAKNLEKLEQDIKELFKEIDSVKEIFEKKQREIHHLKESTRKDAIENLRKEINLINQEYITVTTKMEQYASLLSNNALKKEDILEKINKIGNDIEEGKPKADAEKSELLRLEELLVNLNEELSIQNTQLSQKSSIFNEENILFHQQQNKVTSLEQEISYKQASYDSSKERIEKNQEESRKTEEEIKHLTETADLSEEELIQLYQQKEEMERMVNEAEKEYYSVRGNIEEIEKSIRELRSRRERSDALIIELQNKLNENKLGLTSLKERLSVEFNIDIEDLFQEESQPEGTLEELQQKIQDIKNRLDKIGPINPMAMEAYQEIQERHKFITEQKDDLIKAKESLLTTINEIDTVAKDTFMESFEKIRENFIRVFRSLFTDEDSCDLILTEPDTPLESGIDIIARPKGKRPLTINQLSGGEKTLTAISLLFAIYLLKPAPFCIFDEVDAPLDDANIDKFNNIIRKFSKESQFIIVTHNKRTMSSTDVMYGITMIEQGVSRLVPVDLRSLA